MPRRLVDQDPRREQRRQALLLDRLDARYRGLIAAEIERAMREMVSSYELTGEVISARDHLSRMEAIYRQMAEVSFQVFGSRIIDQGKSAGLVLETKESFVQIFTRLALQFIGGEFMRRRITNVTETTRNQIVSQIDAGFREGQGVAEIAKNISTRIPQIARIRGALIARTETHAAANAGADAAARATGLQLRKEWVAVHDNRTRSFQETNGRIDEFDHRQMDGQIVGMDDPFLMPRLLSPPVPCMYPGDPSLPPGGSINCRCAVSHIVIE